MPQVVSRPNFSAIPQISNQTDAKQIITSWIVSLKEHSQRHHWLYRQRLPKFYDLYRGIRTNRFHVHKNNVSVPLMYTIIWSHAARMVNMCFATNPPIRFMGAGELPDEAKIARKQDNLFNAQFRDARGIEKMLDVMINAGLYGTSVIQGGWRFEKGKIAVPDVATLPFSEKTVQILTEKEVIDFDGPWFEMIDNLDAFPQPGFKHIQDMRWFIRRYWLDLDQVEALAFAGNRKEPIFDPDEVNRLKREGGGGMMAIESLKTMRGMSLAQEGDEIARYRERYARPIEILEAVGITVPDEFAPDGMKFRVLTVANQRYLLRNKPFPFMMNQKPLIAYSPNPDPHYFFSPGKGEICEKLQIGVNKLTNNVLDALDVSIDPWFIFDRAAGIDPRNLFLRPGRWIPVSGPPSERVQAGQVNLGGLQAGIQGAQILWQYMQRATGILDESVIGVKSGGSETARGFLGRQEAVAVRLVLEAMLFERMMLEPLADMFMAFNKQFLETPRAFLMLGDSATIDPVTQEPIPMGRDFLTPNDLVPSYVARAVGTQTRAIRSGRIQDVLLATQIIGQSPTLAAAAASAGWVRLIGRELGLGAEVNELISQNQGMSQMLAMVGGNPNNIPNLNMKEGTPGAVGGLNQLNALAGTSSAGGM